VAELRRHEVDTTIDELARLPLTVSVDDDVARRFRI
jgi:hypothetical protein